MNVEWQMIFNVVFGICSILSAIFGWFSKQIFDAVKELRSDVKAVTTIVQRMEVEMPTHYVRKDDMEARFDRIEALLDKLYEKLDNKADK